MLAERCERSNNRTNLNIDRLKRWCDGKTDSTQTTVHGKVKEGRFNIGPSEQETLGRRWHDVELASGATFFHNSTPPLCFGLFARQTVHQNVEKNGKGTVVEANLWYNYCNNILLTIYNKDNNIQLRMNIGNVVTMWHVVAMSIHVICPKVQNNYEINSL